MIRRRRISSTQRDKNLDVAIGHHLIGLDQIHLEVNYMMANVMTGKTSKYYNRNEKIKYNRNENECYKWNDNNVMNGNQWYECDEC